MKERICREEEGEEEEKEEEEEEKEEVTNALVPNASYDVAPHTHQPKRPPPKIKELYFPFLQSAIRTLLKWWIFNHVENVC